MPRPCPLCHHPDHVKLDRAIRSGSTAPKIVMLAGGKVSAETVYSHKRHLGIEPEALKQAVDQLPLELPSVPAKLPDDLVEWGLMKVIANIESLETITRATGNIRGAEALTSALGRLLDYEKVYADRKMGQDTGAMVFMIVNAVPPEPLPLIDSPDVP